MGDLVLLFTAPDDTIGLIVELSAGGAFIYDGRDTTLHRDGVMWWPPSDMRIVSERR